MSDPLDFIDAYHNGTVVRCYDKGCTASHRNSADSVDYADDDPRVTGRASAGWQVEPARCPFCGPHSWHGLQCSRSDCGCSTSCVNLVMSQSDEHIERGTE